MKFAFSKTFVGDFRRLPQDIQELTDKQLGLLLSNAEDPSPNLKKMKDPRDIREGRIAMAYRFTFQITEDVYVLRKVGTHDVLRNP
jgi:mRNA-degrading endonuclease RelE of RelBE toxin-antitoxin system